MNVFYFIIQQTMIFSIPLLIVALGGMFSERGGVVNIALEGIMIMGAFVSIMFINIVQSANVNINGQLLMILAVLVAGLTGGLYSLFHAYASINMKADQIISGTALNLFAPAFAIFIARMVQQVQQVPFSNVFRISQVPLLSKIPLIGRMFFENSYITTYIGLAILIAAIIVINRTKFGLRLKACGEHPQAADSVGISVTGIRYSGVAISGILAGIGGLVFVIPTSTNFNAEVAGYGFLALAVLIFGQWRPLRVFIAAMFFGVMKTISSTYVAIPFLVSAGIPDYIYKMIPFVATLIVLSFTSKSSQAPKAIGKPYDKGAR